MQTRFLTTLAITSIFAVAAPAFAQHGGVDQKAAPHKKHKRSHHPILTGWLVPASQIRTEPLPRPSGNLKLYAVNFRESLEVNIYNPDGSFNDDALASLYHFWRCKRTGTERPINPQLFTVLSLVQDHFDGRTIELVSGFRNQAHKTSRHFEGNASDIRIAGVSDKELRDFAASLDTGHQGLGLYPRAGFVHVDVRDQSYRWIDYSPAGSSHPSEHRKHGKHRNA